MAAPKTPILQDELVNLLPHKGKMFLLSRVTAYDIQERFLVSEYDIGPDCIFYNADIDGIPSWVSFEFMAQSISALSGIAGKEKGEPPKIGFILSISNLEIAEAVLPSGRAVSIRVKEDCRVDAVFTFHCEVQLESRIIASATLTVMESDDPSSIEKR